MAISYQKWVAGVVKYLIAELNVQEWGIHLEFDAYDEDPGCVAFINADKRYLTAHICLTSYARHEYWDKGNREFLAFAITHEMCHILLSPLYHFAKNAASEQTKEHLADIHEQTTQRIARIVAAKLPSKLYKA